MKLFKMTTYTSINGVYLAKTYNLKKETHLGFWFKNALFRKVKNRYKKIRYHESL